MYTPKQNKIRFRSFAFGCRVNEAEKLVFDRHMIEAGFEYSEANPSIVYINTCAVTQKAEREARQLVYRLKKQYPEAQIVLTGCSATLWRKKSLYSNLPIDLLIDNKDKAKAVPLILSHLTVQFPTPPTPPITPIFSPSSDKFLSSGRLMVKIQDGCGRFCSYCIVPYLRNPIRSNTIQEILSYIGTFAPAPKEIVFTAINTEMFGKETHESLVRLIDASISQAVCQRISFGSIHPWSINQEFIEYYAKIKSSPRFVHFFHIPLQSGSSKILSLMKRDYEPADYLKRLQQIRALNRNAFIATDVIVGFPGETEKEFKETYDFLSSSPISKFHVFRFSSRPGTYAEQLMKEEYVPTSEEKKQRSLKLITLGRQKYREFLHSQLGRSESALFIGSVKKGFQTALFDNQIPVCIPTKKNLCGEIKHVTITKQIGDKLFGEFSDHSSIG